MDKTQSVTVVTAILAIATLTLALVTPGFAQTQSQPQTTQTQTDADTAIKTTLTLKAHMLDPDSFRVNEVFWATTHFVYDKGKKKGQAEDKDWLCINYRSKNMMGGYTQGLFVAEMKNGELDIKDFMWRADMDFWNLAWTACAGKITTGHRDVTDAVKAALKADRDSD